mmetsp:Transcript_15280/g.35222  ORF Transcript_15280/g.35222 Transcript_15280/m.35222 type:complete len:201 (-) Transcript_15280:393-995(-)
MVTSYPLVVLRPVPTAVPPSANRQIEGRAFSSRWMPYPTCWAYPLNSWPTVRGVASWQWVRPILTMWAYSLLFWEREAWRVLRPGSVTSVTILAIDICMAVGKESLLDCPMLTWSLGWTGDLVPTAPPRIWIARFDRTSLTFMLVWVPDPVWKMTRGKCLSSFPSMTSSAASAIAPATVASIFPISAWYSAQHFLTRAMA